jgi:hypothetical protein
VLANEITRRPQHEQDWAALIAEARDTPDPDRGW